MNFLYIIDAHRRLISVVYYCMLLVIGLSILHLLGFSPMTMSFERSTISSTGQYTKVNNRFANSPRSYLANVQTIQSVDTIDPAISVWPLHGMVTTEFGAPDYPYQASHTGIDISSGKPAGVMDVAAFRAGKVINPPWSLAGFGNVVTVDHGGGLISFYGHLASVNVHVGDQVRAGSIIGKEGSTGNSTGPHVHFEIRLNNIPVNPRNFVQGNP